MNHEQVKALKRRRRMIRKLEPWLYPLAAFLIGWLVGSYL